MHRSALLRLLAALIPFTVLAAACGDDATPTQSATETVPTETVPVETVPTETAPTDTASTDDDVDPAPPAAFDTVIALEVVDGELVGGSREVDVDLGDHVQVVVTGNTADEVHVHGYDNSVELVDGAGELDFVADVPGIFEIELEEAGRQLVRMTVS